MADELIKCAKKGKPLNYSRARVVPGLDEVAAFGGQRALDAKDLRDILVGGLHSDPRGVQIRGAYLRGLLDLDGVESRVGLRFTGCRFDQSPALRDAALPWLHLDGCVLPGIAASRARIGTLRVTGCRIEGNSQDGAIQLDGAHIMHELDMRGTSITNNSGAALTGSALNVGDDACVGVLLDGLSAASRAGRSGTIQLAGARITGSLLLRGAWLTNATGPALVADGIRVSADTRLGRNPASGTQFQATGAARTGTVLLRGAVLAGELALHGARIKSVASAGPGQPRDGAGVTPGALCLSGSTIRRDLVLRDTALVNSTGPALVADRVRVGGSALLDRGFLAQGERQDGGVRLARAEVGGDLLLHGARLASGTGPALLADGLTVHGDLMLAAAAVPGLPFSAAGAGEAGTLLLRGASVGGTLSLDGAIVEHLAPGGAGALRAGATLAGPAMAGPAMAGAAEADSAKAGTVRADSAEAGAAEAGTVRAGAAEAGAVQAGPSGAAVALGARAGGSAVPGRAGGSAVPGPIGGPDTGGPGDQIRAIGERVRREMTGGQPARLAGITGTLHGVQPGQGRPGGGRPDDSRPDGGQPSGRPAEGAPRLGQPSTLGAVCLDGSSVGGRLLLGRARLRSDTGPAVRASRLVARAGVTSGSPPGQGLIVIGAGTDGAVCLNGADITGQLALPGATLINATGPALAAGAARIHGDMLLDQEFVAAGVGQAGAVALPGAVVDQALSCSGWFACRPVDSPAAARGPALDLSRASVGTLRLGGRRPAGFVADGGFRLDGLRYSGLPVLGDPELLAPRPQPDRWLPRRLRRPGRADQGRHHAAVAQWLSWLRYETAEHADQPYTALAAAYQAAGQDDLARTILVAQRDDARSRGSADPARRLGQQTARWLTGYGYRCWYALLWLAGLVAVTVGLAVFWFGPAGYIQPTAAGRLAAPASSTSPAVSRSPAARPTPTVRSAPAASPSPAASASLAAHASFAAHASPVASPSPAASPSPTASSPPTASPSPTSSRSPAASSPPAASPSPSGSASPSATGWPARSGSPAASRAPATGHTARTVPAGDPGPAACGVAGRVGYAVNLVLPFLGPPGSCTGTAASGGAVLLAFGWLVRALAITLLVVYLAGLTGLARRRPGPS